MFHLKYTITEEDVLDFNIYHFRNSPSQIKTRRSIKLLYGLLFLLIITLLLSRGQLSWITAGIPTVVFFFLIIFQNRILLGATKKSVKQLFAEGVNRGLYGEQELILNENSIIESGKLMKTEYSYKIIERIEEDERSFYLYFGAVQAIIVKKQLLSGAEEEEQFREYIKSRRTNLATV